MSYKGDRRCYTMEFKREATEYTEKNSNHKAAEKFPVACKWIKQWRPNKYFYGQECDESKKFLFVASNRWVNNFMRCNGFSIRRKTTAAQQDPKRLIDKLILYILHARRLSIKYKYPLSSIIVMNEISIWNGIVSNTTIDKQETKLFV